MSSYKAFKLGSAAIRPVTIALMGVTTVLLAKPVRCEQQHAANASPIPRPENARKVRYAPVSPTQPLFVNDAKGEGYVYIPSAVRELPTASSSEKPEIRRDVEALVKSVQDEICRALEQVEGDDGAKFQEDNWTRENGSHGRTRVLQGGKVFEKAGVGVSVVQGNLPAAAAAQMRSRGKEALSGPGPFPYFACGISLVIHPHNPHAPTSHANYRYFEVEVPDNRPGFEGKTKKIWWFGGGADLTPSYVYEEDAKHFHNILKNSCDRWVAHNIPFPYFTIFPNSFPYTLVQSQLPPSTFLFILFLPHYMYNLTHLSSSFQI